MFCPKCGKKNKKGASFCESCGAKIVEESKKTDSKKKPNKKNKTITIVIVVVIVLLITAFMVFQNNCKPSKVALGYFEALTSNNTSKLYDYLDIPDSEFTTEKIFKEVYNDKEINIINYKVSNEQISSDGLNASVTITYNVSGSDSAKTEVISLAKDKTNKFLIFDNWKISESSSVYTENYKLSVYKDSKVKLEGVTLPSKYKTNDSKRYDVYEIPAIFKGTYDVTVTLKNGLSYESELEVGTSSSTLTNLELSDKNKSNLEKTISSNITTLYSSAIAEKSFSDIKKEFEYTGSDLDDLESYYTTFAKSISSNKLTEYNLKKVGIKDISVNEDGYLSVRVGVDYSYKAKKYFSDEIISKTGDSTAYLTYDYNNGFKLVDINSLTTYFSKY